MGGMRQVGARAGRWGRAYSCGLVVATAVTLVVSAFAGPLGDASADSYAAAPAARSSSAGTLALDPGDWDAQPDAYRGGWVVMQPWEYDRIPALKAQNPDVRVLMYKDVTATVSDLCATGPSGWCDQDQEILPAGVGYWSAMREHPEWFLRTAEGDPLEWSDWPGLHPMDIADPGYQEAWAGSVLDELRAHDWDGVMMDDTLTRLSHSVVDDATSPQVPDDAAMYAATTSFLSRVGPQITGAGYLAVPNVTVDEDNWRSTLEEWSPYVSGWEFEYLVKYGLGSDPLFGDEDWQWRFDLLSWAADWEVPVLAVTYGTVQDRAAQRYHRATWLLAWNGRTGASMYVPEESGVSFWLSPAVTDIGLPSGPLVTVGPDVRLRPYSGGIAVVNSGDEARAVHLGGTYLSRGQAVDWLELAPRSGAVLRSAER
jgi:putative glycosyl hydrolase-like family 15 (GHL15) protein